MALLGSPAKVQITRSMDEMGEVNHLLVTYYSRLATDCIDREIEELIRSVVKESIRTDAVLRDKVTEAIKAATIDLPLEAIAKAVKEAIKEQTDAQIS